MVTLAQLTMNSGLDIEGSVLRWNLINNNNKFDRIIIVDGNLTNEAKEFYYQFKNVIVIDSPWDDSYVKQYKAFADKLEDNEWCLYLDDDEICSNELFEFFNNNNFDKCSNNIFYLPCVLHITEDGKKYYPVEKAALEYAPNVWTKHILFKKESSLDFYHFGSHVIPTHNKNEHAVYCNKPYYHMKSLESFVYNDIFQAFLHPGGQQYDPIEAAQFKLFCKQFKTTKDFKEATKKGKWPLVLQKFAWSKRHIYDRPISRLSWAYFILSGHTPPEKDEKMNWDYVKQFILSSESFLLFDSNKKNNNFVEINV